MSSTKVTEEPVKVNGYAPEYVAKAQMCISSNQFCLEDYTERSESNPGRSLGIIKHEGTAVWKTVPHCCAPSPSAQSARAQRVHG